MSFMEWIFGNNGEKVTLEEVITMDLAELQLHKFAIEKSINLIAKAIVKSNILFLDKQGKKLNNDIAYRVNVQPNDNESKVEFWMKAISKLLTEQEVLIYRVNNTQKLYRVQSYTANDRIMTSRTYSNVTIECQENTMQINRNVSERDMLVLKYPNEKIYQYLKQVIDKYNSTASAINQMIKTGNSLKFKNKIDAQLSLMEQLPDGTTKALTKEEYDRKIKDFISADGIALFRQSNGLDLEQFQIKTDAKVDDVEKLQKNVFSMAAMAFDIPELMYFGNITEKSDATNEFITTAVDPIAKVLETSMDAKFVGYDDYMNGQHTKVDLRNYKHRDILDAATAMDKLHANGWNLDELRGYVGEEPLNTDFSQKRYTTKNYMAEDEF